MLRKFRRAKVTDLTVGQSLAFNFAVPIVQIAGYAVALGAATGVWRRVAPKTTVVPEDKTTSEE